ATARSAEKRAGNPAWMEISSSAAGPAPITRLATGSTEAIRPRSGASCAPLPVGRREKNRSAMTRSASGRTNRAAGEGVSPWLYCLFLFHAAKRHSSYHLNSGVAMSASAFADIQDLLMLGPDGDETAVAA